MILILSWHYFDIILISSSDCWYIFRMPATVTFWYYHDILRFWGFDIIMIWFWYVFHMPAYGNILMLSWYFDILRSWYYHDTIFMFSNDGWYILRRSVYCDILIFWDFDIIMIIIYQRIVDRTFTLHFVVIFWYCRDILILASNCKHVSRMPSQIHIFILSWCFKIIVLSWYFKIIKIKTIIITSMCCLVL